MLEFLPLILFAAVFAALLAGYSVAATLAGVALLFALVGAAFGIFDLGVLGFLPSRLYGIVTNQTLIAVPLFVLMGVTLERTRIADTLLESLSSVMGSMRGGLGIAVTLVGMLMAASTGIVGATVVTMGLLALPTMLRHGYDPRLATGTICATGTLGQIIPPSIALVLLGDVLSGAYQQAQLTQGVFSPKTVSVGDLFAGALLPGLVLVALYVGYIAVTAFTRPKRAPGVARDRREGSSLWTLLRGLAPPLVLIVAVLGSILGGFATPTEAAGVGALGALLLAAAYRSLALPVARDICVATLKTTAMVFFILIGASVFSLVFRGYGGDELVQGLFAEMPGGVWGATVIVMVAIFLLGFILDFIGDHLRGGAHRRTDPAGHGTRPGVAGRADRREPADLVPDAAVRFRAVLPARRRPGGRRDLGHLPGCGALHRAPGADDVHPGGAAGTRHLAAGRPLLSAAAGPPLPL